MTDIPAAPGEVGDTDSSRLRSGLRSWFLSRIDLLLPEPLRRVSPSELVRYRVLAGAVGVVTLTSLLADIQVVLTPMPELPLAWALALTVPCFLTLIALRVLASPGLTGLLLCGSLTTVVLYIIFVRDDPNASTHAVFMLASALAVYLLGPRRGLVIAGFTSVMVGLVHPLYHELWGHGPRLFSGEYYWLLHLAAASCILGGWMVGALHRTAHQEAQTALERTLNTLHDSESKLTSLIENTDDLACSLDREGRLVVANSAWKRVIADRFGWEPVPGEMILPADGSPRAELWRQRRLQVLEGQRLKFEEEYELNSGRVVLESSMGPILDANGRAVGMTVFTRDITARKAAEERLGEMHRTLLDVSRQAGMAEIATGVLHNVGNTLNSVNVSTTMVVDRLRHSRLSGLVKAVELIREHAADMASFLVHSPQGQKLPAYICALSDQLQHEHDAMLREMRSLSGSVDHLKSIVTMQQRHARSAGAIEEVAVPQLIDEALRLHAISLERLGIRIEREYEDVPSIVVDRHKLLQILINLLSNAQHALLAVESEDKLLSIRVHRAPEPGVLLIEVADNGMGIAPEHLPRMFTQGFTTKKTGHGFGLHISALAATEMRGRLSVNSPGPGQGATFTLKLPLQEASSRST
jgi:PAS domain S-box-containing protein